MGWSVGWEGQHQRFRGYGVPAFCDVKDCHTVIDRGLGYGAVENPGDPETTDLPILFVCGSHEYSDIDKDALPPEHPEWLDHVVHDDSWAEWRSENPTLAEQYALFLAAVEVQ